MIENTTTPYDTSFDDDNKIPYGKLGIGNAEMGNEELKTIPNYLSLCFVSVRRDA